MKNLSQHGSNGTGNAIGNATKFANRFPENQQITQALKTLKRLGTRNAITFLSGTTVDGTDKAGSAFSRSYNHLKDNVTYALPADVGIPVTEGAEMWGPTDFIVHTTELASK
jgi:hypothetical protein